MSLRRIHIAIYSNRPISDTMNHIIRYEISGRKVRNLSDLTFHSLYIRLVYSKINTLPTIISEGGVAERAIWYRNIGL